MSEHYPRIRIRSEDGHPLVREGLCLTFYMRCSHMKIAQEVLRSLETYLRTLGPKALGWYIDNEGYEQELDEAGWEHTRRELRERRFAMIELVDADLFERRYRFEYQGKDLQSLPSIDEPNAVCAARFWLPTEFLEEHGPGQVREFALELAAPLPFCSGHVGLCFNGGLDLLGVPEEVLKYCFRYPGIDFPLATGYSWDIGTRVRGPHWMTFLGQPALGALGGVSGLRSKLHTPGTTVQELEGDRAVITLGAWPEAGDTEQGQMLPAYRELARVLEPCLYFEPRPRLPFMSAEATRRWERRFLD